MRAVIRPSSDLCSTASYNLEKAGQLASVPLRAPKHTHALPAPSSLATWCCRSPCKHKQCRAGWLPPGHSSARAAAAAASAATWASPLLPQRLAAARSSRQPHLL